MHLAQVNVARALAPLDSARLADFACALEPTPEEARQRLDTLQGAGLTAQAFTVTHVFPSE